MGQRRQTGGRTTEAVKKARTRKLHNRAMREQQLKDQAGRLNITVMQLVFWKTKECEKFRKVTIYRPEPMEPVSGYGFW